MNKGSTIFLKSAVLVIGLVVLALCIFALPNGIKTDETGYYKPILFSMYVIIIPFYYALYQTIKLLTFIDKNNAFSDLSVKSLKHIKYSALTIAALYTAIMPLVYRAADYDDAPGVIVVGLIFIFASIAIATFAAVLQRLLQDAINIKSENELTV